MKCDAFVGLSSSTRHKEGNICVIHDEFKFSTYSSLRDDYTEHGTSPLEGCASSGPNL